jgi:hypothetical protein
VASKPTLQVGEPVRVLAKLRRDTPEDLAVRIGRAFGFERYVSFDKPGLHRVPISVGHRDGRIDRTEIEFEVVAPVGEHPYPILNIRQDLTNPFLLQISLANADAVHRQGVQFQYEIAGYGSFSTPRPFFVVDCERLLNPTDIVVPFDLHFTVVYPDGERRTARESFRVWNDYAWFKTRGVLKPKLVYNFRARGVRKDIAASCIMINDDDEYVEITGRQIEIQFDDPDRVFVPGPLERMGDVIEPRAQREFNCSIPRHQLPNDALGYAIHFHGRTRSGLKVEASAYFEYYVFKPKRWSSITNLEAVELLQEVKAAFMENAVCSKPQIPRISTKVSSSRSQAATTAPVASVRSFSTSGPIASVFAAGQQISQTQISVTAVRNYVDAMRPTWTPGELAAKLRALDMIIGGQRFLDQEGDAFFLGKQCLLDEEPPSDDLFCKGTGRRGEVYVPARIMNGKKGDVVLLPGGPLGFIGGLLQKLTPPQNFSHCGIMSGNFYKVRHATASEDWLYDEVYGKTVPIFSEKVGTEGFRPESIKYIWPGTIDQTVEQAFSGSFFKYTSPDGTRQKAYKIQAFGNDPVFFLNQSRHVVFPQILKPDPLLEGDPAFAHLRPTLAEVAEKAKRIHGHYRFFCYSNGAISFWDDTAHRAPDRGPGWWASASRPMVCSTFILAAINDITDKRIRMEGKDVFVTEGDLEKTPPAPGVDPPDKDALIDSLTRDGLYFYTAEERRNAADFLYDDVYKKALEEAGGGAKFIADVPSDFGNQVTNTFAFDYSDREFDDEDAKDSEKWKNPGDGRGVSPDDMLMFWDRPTVSQDTIHGLYGTSQRMVFRDGILEERELGTWVKREKIGKLKVTVTYRDKPVPGADVKVGGQVVVTGPQGLASIDLPEGSYPVEVGLMMDGLFFEGSGPAQVKDRDTTEATIVLNDPPEFKRLVVIGGHVRIKDEENLGSDEFFDDSFSTRPNPVRLGPNHRQDVTTYVKKFGGEIRVEARYDLTWNADLSVTVACNVKLYEGTSEDTDDLDGESGDIVTVFKDQENVPMNIHVRNDAEDDDDYVHLDALISNYIDLS